MASRATGSSSANARRIADLAVKGGKAIPFGTAGADGVPVPAAVPERAVMASGWKVDPEPSLVNFAGWVDAYLAAAGDERAALEEQGIELATARRAVLAAQIASDPRRALSNAIPIQVREQLTPAIQALLEERVNGFGEIALLHGLAAEGDPGTPPVDKANIGGITYDAYRYGGRSAIPYIHDVSLHGVSIDGKLAVLDSPVRMLESDEPLDGEIVNESCPISGETVVVQGAARAAEPQKMFQIGGEYYQVCQPLHVVNVESSIVTKEQNAEQTGAMLKELGLHPLCMPRTPQGLADSGVAGSAGYVGKPPASLTHGGKNVLIMRVQPTDKPYPTGYNEAYFNTLVTEPTAGWDVWMRRISYNKTWLNAVHVTPVMNLAGNSAYYTGGGYQHWRWLDDAKAAAVAAGYNLANYSCLVVAHDGYGQYGPAWGGSGAIWCNGNFDIRMFIHEYGHVFWLPHANAWSATDGNPMSPARQHNEYGDANDPMGNAWGANAYNSFNAYYKNLCGWLPDSAVQTVTKSGLYRVYQDDGATALNRTLALKVGRDNDYNYWLSIRGEPIAQPQFNSGVAVTAVSSWAMSDTHLLDLNNPGDNWKDNAPLAVGQTFYDSAADLTIKTIAVGGTNPHRFADVEVTIGSFNTGGYRPMVSGGVYRFRNQQFGKYLTVPGNSSANGVELQGATAAGDLSQNWVVWRHIDGTYCLNHQGTDKWIDVESNSGADYAKIWQYNGNWGDAQQFYISQMPDGHVFLFHKGAYNKVIEMDANNQRVQQMNLNGGNFQRWYPELVGIAPGTYRVHSRTLQGHAMEIQGGGGANGAVARSAPWLGLAQQKWTVSDAGGGGLRLTPNSDFGQALDVDSSGTADGTRVQQYGWNGTNAQRWLLSPTDGNWIRFTPACAPGLSLDAGGLNLVHLWSAHSGYHQQWRFSDRD